MVKSKAHSACACENPDARYTQFDGRALPDFGETDERYGESSLLRCRTCQRLWLEYRVEYEAFGRSGRWARGLIDEVDAQRISTKAATAYLDSLPWYLFGGSYFDGKTGRRSGPMHWG
jgi:hypothetical protein